MQVLRKYENPSTPKRGRALFSVLSLAFLLSLSVARPVSAESLDPRFNYVEMFELTREVMTRKPARQFLDSVMKDQLKVNPELATKYGFTATSVKGFTETQMMTLLQEVPSIRDDIRKYLKEVPADADKIVNSEALKTLRASWREKFKKLSENTELLEKFFQKNNPLEPFIMELAPGKKGYGKFMTYVTHPYYYKVDGVDRLHPPDNAVQAIIDAINSAEKEIRFNVFDFDLDSIADALIAAHNRGVDVMGGIDKGVIEMRPEVKKIYDRLVAAGIPMQAVDSVGLNHQKLITINWSVPGKGKVIMSEGNFTSSCLSPGGDLSGTALHSADSVPNANMVNIVESDELALVVHHELTKTIDPRYALRGNEYPISGAYKLFGETPVGKKARWLTIAFTPNGALDSVSQNFIGRAIISVPGPVSMSQFAASSKIVEEALFAHALSEKAAGREFIFKSIGDTPFALQYWSIFLDMSGYSLDPNTPKETRKYVKIPDSENKWLEALGPDNYEKLKQSIRIAPKVYGTHFLKTLEGSVEITAKDHHKLYIIGEPPNQIAIFGSFNTSEGAEKNQEYIIALYDEELSEKMQGIVRWLSENSERSVTEEVTRRNIAKEFLDDIGTEVEAAKAGRNTKKVTEKKVEKKSPKKMSPENCKLLLKPA